MTNLRTIKTVDLVRLVRVDISLFLFEKKALFNFELIAFFVMVSSSTDKILELSGKFFFTLGDIFWLVSKFLLSDWLIS